MKYSANIYMKGARLKCFWGYRDGQDRASI